MTTGISSFAEYSTLKIVQTTRVIAHYFKLINSAGTELVSASTNTSDNPISVDLTSLNLDSTELYRFRIQGGAIGGTSGETTTVTKRLVASGTAIT